MVKSRGKVREDVDSNQGADTLAAFVRKSSRVSGGISMSSFLACNKAQVSQICEGDKYPTRKKSTTTQNTSSSRLLLTSALPL
eukprot:30542_2